MDLNQENLIQVLSIANGSERNFTQQEAETQLKLWEAQPGYHYLLQSIYLNVELPLQIRWLAIICFKNGVDKHWRASRVNAIGKDEKTQIKQRLFHLIDEKNNQLMIQNAHSVARIVRFDFPNDWPNLFDELHKNLHDYVFIKNNLSSTNNILIILNQIIKTLASVRIGRSRHAMQSKAPVIAPLLIKLYVKFFQQWTNDLDLGIMEICYLCLKNLRRIIPEGFEHPNKNLDVVDFLKVTVDHLQLLIKNHDKYSSDLIERYAKCYSKLYYSLININPTSFILMPSCELIVSTYFSILQEKAEIIYTSNNEENDFWETIALKAFLILKRLLAYIYKKGAITLKQPKDKQDVNIAIEKLSTQFFNPQIIQQLCDLIINWYLLLKPNDLESWLLEPEEWCNEEFSSSWEYQIRPCAENFFQDLITYFDKELSDFILNKISNNLLNNTNVLVQDAILCTFQLSADSIADKVDFNALLKDVFIPMALRNTSSDDKIIKRRICLVISDWVKINCSNESRVEIYKLLNVFLSSGNTAGENVNNDVVVKLSSIQCLLIIVDDWDFNKKDFEPFLGQFIANLIGILQQMNLTESKLYILNTLAVLIERCNPLIGYDTLMSLLGMVPKYWEMSNDEAETILKNSLIRILKNLVISLNENSIETYYIALPIIETCCSENSENFQFLSEDGYELWLALLQYFPQNNSTIAEDNKGKLLSLFELVNSGLVNATEVLPLILSILRSYSLLAPEIFASPSATNLLRILSEYLNKMRDDSYNIFITFVDILFLQNSRNDEFLKIAIDSGLINSMINYVSDDNQSVVNANKILLVLSRLAFSSSDFFLNMINYLSSNNLSSFIETWLKFYVNNGNPRNQKINLLAFLSLLNISIDKRNDVIITQFPQIIKNTLLFLEEIKESPNGYVDAYQLNLVYEDIDDYRYLDPDIKENGEKLRYMELLQKADPVFNVNVQTYLTEVIGHLKSSFNGNEVSQLVTMCDEYTVEQLNALIH